MPLDYDIYLCPVSNVMPFETSYTLYPTPDLEWEHNKEENNWYASIPDVLDKTFTFGKSCRDAQTTLQKNLSNSSLILLDAITPKAKLKKKKNHVSFADSQGLPLVTVCLIESCIEDSGFLSIPKLNDSKTLSIKDINDNDCLSPPDPATLTADFSQPASDYAKFLDKLNQNQVALENITADAKTVWGTIKVRNIAFHKHVKVRCTIDNWNSFTDIETTHVSTCNYSKTDTFIFEFSVASSTKNMEFALCYSVNNEEFWDNNNGCNYVLYR